MSDNQFFLFYSRFVAFPIPFALHISSSSNSSCLTSSRSLYLTSSRSLSQNSPLLTSISNAFKASYGIVSSKNLCKIRFVVVVAFFTLFLPSLCVIFSIAFPFLHISASRWMGVLFISVVNVVVVVVVVAVVSSHCYYCDCLLASFPQKKMQEE